MNILVTNDDGLYTPGIWTLAEAMTAVGTVTVMAPDREQSGVGAAVTIQHPVRVSKVMPRIEGVKAYSVEGTPGDCVILAMQGIMPKPDLVVSSINEGANTGIYVMMSGTVGAAVHANLWGAPSIALSVTTLTDVRFDAAAAVGQVLAQMFLDETLTGPMLLNVNLPNIAVDEIEDVLVTKLAQGAFEPKLEKAQSPKHDYYYIARGKTEWDAEKGSDIWAVRNRRVSITPLHLELTSDVFAPVLAEFAPVIAERLKNGRGV